MGGHCYARLSVKGSARLEGVELAVQLSDAGADEPLRPAPLVPGTPLDAEFKAAGPIAGVLRIGGLFGDAPPISFGVQTGEPNPLTGNRENFVGTAGRSRTVLTHAAELEAGSGLETKGGGIVIEASISQSGPEAELTVNVRRAKKKELARLCQERVLLAEITKEKPRYSTLLAQITKARTRKVETKLLEEASQVLRAVGQAEGTYLDHAQLKKLMKWKRVTGPDGPDEDIVEDCAASSSCPCNAGQAQDGEVFWVHEGAAQKALEGVAPKDKTGDKWLFQALVAVAMAQPEGCCWKSGGKFLLTNEERNQSPTAIVNFLERDNPESDAGKGIRALVQHTESLYGFKVTAIQINFHPNEKSSHKQHRDIFGAGQKAGINCTCSFMKCVGTVCYSLGSSRRVLCETISDDRSKYEACCEECTGRKVFKYMHSGSAMYFNGKWNDSHTHGVPPWKVPVGPRISVALLCA